MVTSSGRASAARRTSRAGRPTVLVLAAVGALAAPLVYAGTGSAAPAAGSPTPAAATARTSADGQGRPRAGIPASGARATGDYDVRALTGATLARHSVTVHRAHGRATAALGRTLSQALGSSATVSIDPLTGTVRDVTDASGSLTPSLDASLDASAGDGSAAQTALTFVRAHLAGLGLVAGDLATLHRTRSYTDLNGITHVYWSQRADGLTVFGNGLRAAVGPTGRLLDVQGAPISGLVAAARQAPDPRLDATTARRTAARDVGITGSGLSEAVSDPDGSAQPCWFHTPTGLRRGWTTYTSPTDTTGGYQHVLDAVTGRTLYRFSTSDNLVAPTAAATRVAASPTPSTHPVRVPVAAAHAPHRPSGQTLVWDFYPGARGATSGGHTRVVNLYRQHFLAHDATWLHGRWAKVWADVDDDNRIEPREKTAVPRDRTQFVLHRFATSPGQPSCTNAFPCTDDPSKPRSWRTNENQDAVQGLFFASRYGRWLSQAPFGFTASSGNFRADGGDAVRVQILDGADTDHGLPDGDHINNANFDTPPDGRAPTMQMYLNDAPYIAADSAETFDDVGHEYTHGLSSRLVVDSQGDSTLSAYQAGAMGEGWSDFYAEDFLVSHHYFVHDTSAPGEIMFDRYLSKNHALTRTEAIDCPVGAAARLCRGVDGDSGGYTFGDIGAAGALGTEVHSASEPWSQTLWDLRRALGHDVTMRLVTEAMRLSPDDPSMLDERDAILLADQAIYGGRNADTIWRVFTHRGFGYYAAVIDAADTDVRESFAARPAADATPGTIAGTVTDTQGQPVSGVTVAVAGHTSGVSGTDSAVTDAAGTYRITGVAPGTYPKVVALGAGYESLTQAVTVTSGADTDADFSLRRDWAAATGGATVASYDGPDYSSSGCGPDGAIDGSHGIGWGSVTGPDEDHPATSAADVTPKSIVIALPQPVAVTSVGVDPSATCGDSPSSSTAGYRLEVGDSATGPWTTVGQGTFTADQVGTTVDVPVSVPAPVTYVRYTMLSPQVDDYSQCPDGLSGCTYMDTTEVSVYSD